VFFKGMSLRKPEKQAVPPVQSGPKPYKNALRASGSSTTMREHRRLEMSYNEVDQLLCCAYVPAALGRGTGEEVAGRRRPVRARQVLLGTPRHPASVSLPRDCGGCP
jgi:hypothetical protein